MFLSLGSGVLSGPTNSLGEVSKSIVSQYVNWIAIRTLISTVLADLFFHRSLTSITREVSKSNFWKYGNMFMMQFNQEIIQY